MNIKIKIFLTAFLLSTLFFIQPAHALTHLTTFWKLGYNHCYSAHENAARDMKQTAIWTDENIMLPAMKEMEEDAIRQGPVYDAAVADMRRCD